MSLLYLGVLQGREAACLLNNINTGAGTRAVAGGLILTVNAAIVTITAIAGVAYNFPSGTTIDTVVAVAPTEGIVAVIAGDEIIAGAAANVIVAFAAPEQITAAVAGALIGDVIVTLTAGDLTTLSVGAVISYQVIAFTTVDDVVAAGVGNDVVPRAALKAIVAEPA